jgi:hypothetical protein
MNKKINNITLGCDPEVFLRNNEGEFIASCGKFGGTKHSPLKLTDVGHYMQEDNVALEFNIPPVIDKKSFNREINIALNLIQEKANHLNLNLAIESSGIFKDEELQHPAAKAFGCSSDYNAWTKRINKKPSPNTNLRTCGGHIHIGYDNPTLNTNLEIIKTMDLFLGLPSLFIDDDVERRTMYGKAGCFRNKSFGVEYRVLSNFWLKSNELINWAYDNTLEAINFINNNTEINTYSKDIQKVINTNDKSSAVDILKYYNIHLPILKKVNNYKN